LSYADYTNLAKGLDGLTNKKVFKLNWRNLNLEIIKLDITLRGIDIKFEFLFFRLYKQKINSHHPLH